MKNWFLVLLFFLPLSACANNTSITNISAHSEQRSLPEHLQTGQQIRIGNSHYLILDQVQAFDQNSTKGQQRIAASTAQSLGQKGPYNLQASQADPEGKPVVWNQSTQQYAVLLDEIGLVLNNIEQAEQVAQDYQLNLSLRIARLKRAYYKVDANLIPELMRRLQQDERVKEVLPTLFEHRRQPM
ncbi:hypothetical protein SAMN02745127_01790 [Oceanospirillum multiglobuliferum]|uniref:Uncharacterized protein n=1 Tax=Oceanospirillum multiglobuliferum TaxID=64969 RepID=A0A1T4Q9K8_9GAMM|nr:hypothetical protein [Oceanospirillum multiglobuliferum]OPX56567.1 hypothetical protein BTE48_03860 [Oceanospirillum multiglobuliferum]SKA00337.1 hypothetical protein SAMN02745127_01790 [Oceanospirillum multiglobuliferum]